MVKTEKEIIEELKEEIKELSEVIKEAKRQLETNEELNEELSKEFTQMAQMLDKRTTFIERLNRSIIKFDKEKCDLTLENRKLKKIIKENGLEIGN